MQEMELENENSDNDEIEEMELPADSKTFTAIKVLVGFMIFLAGVGIGGGGHKLYNDYVALTSSEIVDAGAMLGGIDWSVNVCTDVWSFSCSKYAQTHMSSSFISDAQVKPLLEAQSVFVNSLGDKDTPAQTFYKLCTDWPLGNTEGCADVAGIYKNETLEDYLYRMWRDVGGHNMIGITKILSPFTKNLMELALWRYDLPTVATPSQVTEKNDPCDLMTFSRKLMQCSETNPEPECKSPTLLLYSKPDDICRSFKLILSNYTDAALNASTDVLETCYEDINTLSTSIGCFSKASKIWPEPSDVYARSENAKSQKYKNEVELLFLQLKETLVDLVGVLGSVVQDKVKSITLNNGWSDTNLNSGPPASIFDHNTDKNNTMAEILFKTTKWKNNDLLSQTISAVPRWDMRSFDLNAYYRPSENSVYIPEALWTIHSDLPGMQYGKLAFIIAHEISHSIDVSSILMDKHGMSTPIEKVMPSEESRDIYKRFADCAETAPEHAAEDFADHLGILLIMKLTEHLSTMTHEIGYGNQSLNSKQQVPISMAQFWCETQSDAEESTISIDSHSKPKTRVETSLGPLLTQTFNCPKKSKQCYLQ